MELEGKIWKEGRFWLVEIPSLDAMTQGKTRKEALFIPLTAWKPSPLGLGGIAAP